MTLDRFVDWRIMFAMEETREVPEAKSLTVFPAAATNLQFASLRSRRELPHLGKAYTTSSPLNEAFYRYIDRTLYTANRGRTHVAAGLYRSLAEFRFTFGISDLMRKCDDDDVIWGAPDLL